MPNGINAPFQICGINNSTVHVDVTATPQVLVLPPISQGGFTGVFTVLGNKDVFLACNGETANVDTSMPLIRWTSQTITIPGGATNVSVVSDSPGSTLYVTVGIGV